MNALSNITAHPLTTIFGFLSAVTTICGVLAQNGVMGPSVGTGTATVVTLIGAIAGAICGLIAKDPNYQAEQASPTDPPQSK